VGAASCREIFYYFEFILPSIFSCFGGLISKKNPQAYTTLEDLPSPQTQI
jgi:hypothetical protein